MTRDPEWDDTQREWALELADYEAKCCPECGVHFDIGHDLDVERNVEMAPRNTCEDCAAIAADRKRYHEQQRHTEDKCDCDDQIWVVTDYIPIPDEE